MEPHQWRCETARHLIRGHWTDEWLKRILCLCFAEGVKTTEYPWSPAHPPTDGDAAQVVLPNAWSCMYRYPPVCPRLVNGNDPSNVAYKSRGLKPAQQVVARARLRCGCWNGTRQTVPGCAGEQSGIPGSQPCASRLPQCLRLGWDWFQAGGQPLSRS